MQWARGINNGALMKGEKKVGLTMIVAAGCTSISFLREREASGMHTDYG